MPKSLFGYIWRAGAKHQVALCALSIAVFLLSTVPLELQRRLVNDAIKRGALDAILWLALAYAAVSLGLLHGSQPDVIVVCHEAGRETLLGIPEYLLPTLPETIELNLALGRRTNPAIRCAGVSINTSRLSPEDAERYLQRVGAELGVPAADPIRAGARFERLIDACLG